MILLMTTARITMNLTLPVTAAILLAVIRSLILLRTSVMAPEILPEGILPEEMLLRFRITQRLPVMAMSQVKITTGIM